MKGTVGLWIEIAVARSRDLLRRLLKDHATDDARQMLAEHVIQHLEESGFELVVKIQRKIPEAHAGFGDARESSALA